MVRRHLARRRRRRRNPEGLALDFAVPIPFLALVGPSLRSLPHRAAAAVSVGASLALAWLPYDLWLLVAALLAMATGAFVEARLEPKGGAGRS